MPSTVFAAIHLSGGMGTFHGHRRHRKSLAAARQKLYRVIHWHAAHETKWTGLLVPDPLPLLGQQPRNRKGTCSQMHPRPLVKLGPIVPQLRHVILLPAGPIIERGLVDTLV